MSYPTSSEKWKAAVLAKRGYYEPGVMATARRWKARDTHRCRSWLALKIAPWLD